MAETENKPENNTEEPEIQLPKEPKGKSLLGNKYLIIGVPVFIIQLIAVYFVTANVLLSKINENSQSGASVDTLKHKKAAPVLNNQDIGKVIYSIDDIIVNPAGTDGKRLLLTSLGFDINTEEEKLIMQNKEIIIKDVVINTLSSTYIDKLNNFNFRDTLKTDLTNKIRLMIPDVKINRIYFSKFILQ